MPDKSQMYEIVPVDPLSKLQKKNDSLESDIREIKTALRGTVGLSKLEANADGFIKRMLDLLTTSQKMVEEVANSNQQVAQKIQTAIDHMNKANDALSSKLTKILDFFAQAADTMGGEGESGVSELSESLSDSLTGLKKTMENMAEQNDRSNHVLESIEKHLKRQSAPRRQMPPRPMLPMPGAPPGQMPPPPLPGQPFAPPAQQQPGQPNLPPPPFPP